MGKEKSEDNKYRYMVLALVSFGTLFLEGRVLCDLWRWFVVPMGAAPMSYWQSMGVGLMVNMLVRPVGIKRDTDKAVAESLVVALVAWCVGWAFSFAMRA